MIDQYYHYIQIFVLTRILFDIDSVFAGLVYHVDVYVCFCCDDDDDDVLSLLSIVNLMIIETMTNITS